MISIICQTVSCLQMYLGSGYIVSQTPNAILYYNFEKTFYCSRSSYVYNCRALDSNRFIGATSFHFH